MSGSTSRNKGANGERELVHKLRDFYGLDIRRGDCFRGEPDIVGLSPVHPEVKRSENPNVWAWIRQAAEEMKKKKDGDFITIFYRKNRSTWVAITPLLEWTQMGGSMAGGGCVGNPFKVYDWSMIDAPGGVEFVKGGEGEVYHVGPLKEWVDNYITWKEKKQ